MRLAAYSVEQINTHNTGPHSRATPDAFQYLFLLPSSFVYHIALTQNFKFENQNQFVSHLRRGPDIWSPFYVSIVVALIISPFYSISPSHPPCTQPPLITMHTIYDILGCGFGPANLGIAVALVDKWGTEQAGPSTFVG